MIQGDLIVHVASYSIHMHVARILTLRAYLDVGERRARLHLQSDVKNSNRFFAQRGPKKGSVKSAFFDGNSPLAGAGVKYSGYMISTHMYAMYGYCL